MFSTGFKSGPFKSLGSFSNHDDDGNEIPHKFAYLTMKNSILHALHVRFSFLDILKTFSFFLYHVKWPDLQLCGRREQTMTNIQFCLLISEALVPI